MSVGSSNASNGQVALVANSYSSRAIVGISESDSGVNGISNTSKQWSSRRFDHGKWSLRQQAPTPAALQVFSEIILGADEE